MEDGPKRAISNATSPEGHVTDPKGPTSPGDPTSPGEGDRWPSRDSVGGPRHEGTWMHKFVLEWGNWLVRGYYDVEMRGEPFPKDTPVLLVQNHTNGLCDAHFLMSSTTRPIRILVKYTLMKTPLIGWMLRGMHAVPMYRKKDGVDTRKNAGAFEAIDEALRERTVIGLFPEGESLNATALRDLHSGVARMAVSAVDASDHDLGLQIVPIGLTYEERDRFRSHASAVIGKAIDVGPILEPVGTDNMRRASRALMTHIEAGMSGLILNAASEEEFDAVVALERLLPSDERPLGVRRREAADALRSDTGPDAGKRREAITDLGSRFADARLRSDDVLGERPGFVATHAPLLWLVPLFLVGLIAWLPSIVLALVFSRFRKTPDKLVTLRVLGGFTGFCTWVPILTLILAWTKGWIGVVAAAALFAVTWKTFTWTIDRLFEVRAKRICRAFHSRPEEIGGLRDAIGAIRSAFAGH